MAESRVILPGWPGVGDKLFRQNRPFFCLTRRQKNYLSEPEHLNKKLGTLYLNVTLLEVPELVGHISFACQNFITNSL